MVSISIYSRRTSMEGPGQLHQRWSWQLLVLSCMAPSLCCARGGTQQIFATYRLASTYRQTVR